ncbi:class A beta-lactamase, subclass A2 [Runella sp.]|uniref:class A beta-lactamase, subclass A2 n=1 Tax=Runella sp. TaxID=1960881 RepID=UPI00301B0E86
MQKPILKTTLFIFLTLCVTNSFGQIEKLRQKIQQIASSVDGKLGIAVLDLAGEDTLTMNGKGHFAMQSVYKFHLGLAVLDQVDKEKFKLDQKILVRKKDLLPNTWSPLREKYPNGEVEVPLSELLQFTVAQSDNNGCDILFNLVGSPKTVDTYIKNLGIKDVAISTTEQEMHQDPKAQFTNWSTPWSTVKLLEKFYQKKILSASGHDFMWKTLAEETTGSQKLKGLLPKGTVVAHKSGLSGTDEKGLTAATNDIGIVTLPNGKHYAIAVFFANTKMADKDSDRVIAEVSKAVWDYFSTK